MTTTKLSPRKQVKGTSVQKTFTLTNNSDSDVVVIETLNNPDLPLLQIYELSLNTLKTTGDKTIIKSKEQGIFSLDESFDETSNEIIIAKADSLFPVKYQSLSTDSQSQNYSPVTVTNDNATAMLLAEKFVKTITAFPTSDLSKEFSAALSDTDVTKVNTFFESNQDYKTLTLDMVVAVQTYYSQYSFGWANYKAKMKYHVYTSDGTKNTGLGTVTITNKLTSPLSVDKPTPGCSASFTTDDKTTQLYFSQGQFVSDINSDAPAICLQGSFILKSQFTKDDNDDTLISILSGTVNNNDVMAMEEDLDKNGDDKWYDMNVLLHPQNTKGWLILIGGIIGAIVVVGILAKTAKMAFDAIRKNKPVERLSANEKLRADMQKVYDKLGKKTKLPDDIDARWNDLKKNAINLLLTQQKQALLDVNNRQGEYLNELLGISNSDDVQLALGNVGEIYNTIFETNAADLPRAMEQLTQDIKATSTTIDGLRKKYNSKIKSEEKKALDNSRNAIERITSEIGNGEELRKELESDEVPEIRE